MKLIYNEKDMNSRKDPFKLVDEKQPLPKDWALWLSEQLLRWRWWLMGLISLMVVLVEVDEHIEYFPIGYPPDFFRETIIFGLVIPLLNGFVLTLLARTRADKDSAERNLDQAYSLSQELAQAQDWDELTSVIVRYPAKVLVVYGASLYISDIEKGSYELVASWMREDQRPVKPKTLIQYEDCSACEITSHQKARHMVPCIHQELAVMPGTLRSYCLPLAAQARKVGLLILYLPIEMTMLDNKVRLLLGALPEIALSLESARLQQSSISNEQIASSERRRIARNLHDTLGQNVSYLRFKLDQLTSGDVLQEITEIRSDLQRMREIADEAYGQVRATLAELNVGHDADLGKYILEYANLIGQRAGFQVHLAVNGRPHNLSLDVKRQILYICREALNNIEKHAQARNIHVELLWSREALTLTISDDGAGFNQGSAPPEGHYGLLIMQERAREIQATLQISAREGIGTQVSLWLPSAVAQPAAKSSVTVQKNEQ